MNKCNRCELEGNIKLIANGATTYLCQKHMNAHVKSGYFKGINIRDGGEIKVTGNATITSKDGGIKFEG